MERLQVGIVGEGTLDESRVPVAEYVLQVLLDRAAADHPGRLLYLLRGTDEDVVAAAEHVARIRRYPVVKGYFSLEHLFAQCHVIIRVGGSGALCEEVKKFVSAPHKTLYESELNMDWPR